jgi:hypothetical protein
MGLNRLMLSLPAIRDRFSHVQVLDINSYRFSAQAFDRLLDVEARELNCAVVLLNAASYEAGDGDVDSTADVLFRSSDGDDGDDGDDCNWSYYVQVNSAEEEYQHTWRDVVPGSTDRVNGTTNDFNDEDIFDVMRFTAAGGDDSHFSYLDAANRNEDSAADASPRLEEEVVPSLPLEDSIGDDDSSFLSDTNIDPDPDSEKHEQYEQDQMHLYVSSQAVTALLNAFPSLVELTLPEQMGISAHAVAKLASRGLF